MHASGHAVSELDLRITHAVTTNHSASSLNHLGEAACQYSFENSCIAVLRKTDHCQGVERPSSHRVNVAQRVHCRDLPEGKRIIHDRCKEIDGLHQRHIV